MSTEKVRQLRARVAELDVDVLAARQIADELTERCEAREARIAELEREHALCVVELAAVRRLASEREAEQDAALAALEVERDHYRAAAKPA
jgi:hypothetical protein